MIHKLCAHRIFVHVAKFLFHFRPRVHVEIIITALPEAAELRASFWEAEYKLPWAFAFSGAQGTGDPLLETLDNLGGRCAAGLAYQQVHVFGHEHVAHESKTVTRPRLFERADC